MLPSMSGLEVCRRLRERGRLVPVLMLSARDQVDSPNRWRASRRCLRRSAPSAQTTGLAFRSVQVDSRRTEVIRDGRPVSLSAREFHLLRYLVEHRGETIPRERLLKEVCEYSGATKTRTLDVHIGWLRQKLEENPRYPACVFTVRRLGYPFNA